MSATQDVLAQLDACHEAREWASDTPLATLWRTCERGHWMLWLAAKAGVDWRLVARAAVGCARTALPFTREDHDVLAACIRALKETP